MEVVGRLAVIRLEKGDTIPDIARHFGLGTNAVTEANPDVDIWAPAAGERILLPMRFILPDGPRNGIVINLPAMRLFYFKNRGKEVSTYPLGIGTEAPPTDGQYAGDKESNKTNLVCAGQHRGRITAKGGTSCRRRFCPGRQPLGEYAPFI